MIFWVRSQERFMAAAKRNDDPAGTHRVFRSEPTQSFIDEVLDTIRETGQPEICDGLFHGKVPSDVPYKILRRIDIDRKKRPQRDMAPCPMCTSNRFLGGSLIYVPSLQIAAVIGHCCAEHAAVAEREFRIQKLTKWEEDYLLDAMPFVESKQQTAEQARAVANEVQRVYRLFRARAPITHALLRQINERYHGRLLIHDFDERPAEEKVDYLGPAGFGRGKAKVREISLGEIIGTTAVLREYKPVKELYDVIRTINSVNFAGDEMAAIEFISGMSPEQRRAAVATLQFADTYYDKFVRRIRDFIEFFSDTSVSRLNAFGTHPLNARSFSTAAINGRTTRVFKLNSTGEDCTIVIDKQIFSFDFSWKMIPYSKKPS
jgi:hypothetical protein